MPVNKFEQKFDVSTPEGKAEALVEFIEKEEEKFLIMTVRRLPRQGIKTENLSVAQQKAAIELAKEWYEFDRGRELLRFRRDPLAGGMTSAVPVKEQLYRAGIERAEVNGIFGNSLLSQGKVGHIIGNRESNIKPGQNIMVARSAWVGEWI